MTLSKTTLTVSSIFVALMFGGGVYVLSNMNVLLKPQIERIATQTLGVPVTIGGLDISIPNKTASVTDIAVGNAEGFKSNKALTVERVSVTVLSVTQKLVEMNTFTMTGTNVYLDIKQNGTNWGVLRDKLQAKAGTQSPSKADQGKDAYEGPKVIIDLLSITGGKLNTNLLLQNNEPVPPVDMPDILLSDVGRDQGGVTPHDVIAGVTKHLISEINKKAFNSGFYEMLSADALAEIGVNQVSQFKERLTDEVNKVGDALKRMLNQDEEESAQ